MHAPFAPRRISRVIGALATLLVMPSVVHAQTWAGVLSGANEVAPVSTPATGFVTISLTNNTLSVLLSWSGLIGGNPSAAHLHCCTAPGANVGVAIGFPGFPATTSGTYSNPFDLTTNVYAAAFVTNFGGGTLAGAQTALINGLNNGTAYVNIHNGTFGGGEIRANVTVTPEPGTVLLTAAGLLGLGVALRRRGRISH